MKNILMAASALTVIGSAAFAGGFNQPVVEQPVQQPAPVMAPVSNWDGFYAGVQLGYGKPHDALDTDGALGGVHAGYLKDMGGYVLGGELAYNAASMDSGLDGKVKNATDMKLIAGVPSGKWLTYGALGASYMDAKLGDENHGDIAPMIGAGVKYQVSDQWTVGAEADYRRVNGFDGTGEDLTLPSIAATASFRF